MKKFIVIIAFVSFTLKGNSQISVLSNGNVGINNSNPTYKLDVGGTARIHNWTDIIIDCTGFCCSTPVIYPQNDWYLQLGKSDKRVGTIFVSGIHYGSLWGDSDEKLKENIDSLENPMPQIMKIHGYHYNFKESAMKGMPTLAKASYSRKQIGFIAQELEKEFPELVYKPDSVRSTYAVNYIGMIPVLLEGLKNQQRQIDNLQKIALSQEQDIIDLKNQVALLKNGNSSKTKSAKVVETETIPSAITSNQIALYQNAPNPFNQSTQIGYYIPDATQSATLYIYNMNGLQIKSIPIQTKGNGNVTINGSELKAGMYIYTLVADGKEIDTKRMILTE
jgi:hypothetical protein